MEKLIQIIKEYNERQDRVEDMVKVLYDGDMISLFKDSFNDMVSFDIDKDEYNYEQYERINKFLIQTLFGYWDGSD